jgi:hypothetical protein
MHEIMKIIKRRAGLAQQVKLHCTTEGSEFESLYGIQT